MVLITVAGVVFLVVRRPRDSSLVALNEQAKPAPESAVKPLGDVPQQAASPSQFGGVENKQGATTTQPSLQSSPSSDGVAKLDQPKTGDSPAAPAKSAKEAEAISNPTIASKKAESTVAENAPAYSPPPPGAGQRADTQSREQQQVRSAASASGPRQAEQSTDKFKLADRGRDQASKDSRGEDDNSRLAANQAPARKRASDEKVKGPRRDVDNNVAMNRNSNEVRTETAKTQGVVTAKPAAAEEKPPETRSAGGRKFKRQGSAWVDVKFKSSLPLRRISRGSGEFDELDSGLRSIAQQLGGEVIVVWKGKAYLIK